MKIDRIYKHSRSEFKKKEMFLVTKISSVFGQNHQQSKTNQIEVKSSGL